MAESLKAKWDRADAAEKTADSLHWQVAETLAQRNDAGESQRTLAAETDRHQRTVGRMIQVHRQFGGAAGGPTFREAIEAVKGTTPEAENIRKDESAARKVLRETPEKVVEALTEAPPEQRHAALKALAENDTTRDEVLNAGVAAIGSDREGRVPVPKRAKRQGALDAWGYLSSWAKQSEERARMALEKLRSVDERFPDDLRDDALQSVDVTITAWELVRATLKGETVGDEAEAFLAGKDK